jgi:hypothetical protein
MSLPDALRTLGLSLLTLLPGQGWFGRPDPAPPPPVLLATPPALPVRFLGDDAGADDRARIALTRVLATEVGLRARQLLESGTLQGPLTIEVNHRGDQFTRYRVPGRELGETIVFDPDRLPLVDTEAGLMRALPETVLAHELGHAVFKLVSEEAVITAIENPVRDALGVPRRKHF